MFAPFTLALTLAAAAAQATPAATGHMGLEVIARTTHEDGRTTATTLFTLNFPQGVRPITRFVFVPSSVCDSIATSEHEPANAMYAWRIFVGPVTYAPASRAPVRADLMVTTHRMRAAADKGLDAPMFLALPTQTKDRSGTLDRITGLRRAGGCSASAVTLEARLLPLPQFQTLADKLVEAELWFVHKAPDGKETTQRQAVRMRDGSRGDFYFDDMTLTLTGQGLTSSIAVEVFGTIHTGAVQADGDVNMTLYLTRRYINKAPVAFGVWPKTGKAEYPTTVKAGEVVSFLLPPLADDGGMFLGHRFSVRLRIKPIGEPE